MDHDEMKDELDPDAIESGNLDDGIEAESDIKKKKDLIEEDSESLEDLAEDELEEEEEPFDDKEYE